MNIALNLLLLFAGTLMLVYGAADALQLAMVMP
jgi:hypothetical protein